MFSNKEEALREREAAVKLIISKNYVMARQKLLRAKQLFPSLDDIGNMLVVCDILSASGSQLPGYGTDHYWVLELVPYSSSSDVSSRYRKLLNLLLPMKSKFPDTEYALKLIEDAHSVLSDANKRIAFDLMRKTCWEGFESLELSAETGISRAFGKDIDGKNGESFSQQKEKESKYEPLADPPNLKNNFQEPSASSSYVNSVGNSGEEIDMPLNNEMPQELQNESFKVSKLSEPYDFEKDRKPEMFEKGQIWAAHFRSEDPRYAVINANYSSSLEVTWLKPVPIGEGERRWCDAGLPVACGSFWLDFEKSKQEVSHAVFSYCCSPYSASTEEQYEIYPKEGEVWAVFEDFDLDEWPYTPEIIKTCKVKFVEILSSKYFGATGAVLVNLDSSRTIFQRLEYEGVPVVLDISPNSFYMLSHKVPAYKFSGDEVDDIVEGMFELDQLALPNDNQNKANTENSDSFIISSGSSEPLPSPPKLDREKKEQMNCSPSGLIAGQVWAVYGGKDRMPRAYAKVNDSSSSDRVCVTYLESLPYSDHERTWKRETSPSGCGLYATTGTTVSLQVSQFPHLVKCQQGTIKLNYRIYPMKNEVWAIYKNWKNTWIRYDYENSGFEVVEVLSEFSEGDGIMVARLSEVKGCLTFFNRQQSDGFDLTQVVPASDVVSFSHRIPAFRVPGIGRHGIPESCWHLEPEALPVTATLNRAP